MYLDQFTNIVGNNTEDFDDSSFELTDPGSWNIEETIANISKLDPSLAGHVEAFRTHEIDGKLFY